MAQAAPRPMLAETDGVSPHAWRDDVLSAADANAATRSMREWLAELDYADRMGWLTHEQHAIALAELDEFGRVWSAATAQGSAEDAAYAVEAEIIHAMWTQGLSACPIGRAA